MGSVPPIIGAEEKTKKLQNPPKGLTVLKSITAPEPLNIFRLFLIPD